MKYRLQSLVLAGLAATFLAGCAPLVVGAAAGGAMLMASDRRTTGAQVDDEAIELRAGSRLGSAFGDRAHIAVTSYNRQVLLTGEVPDEASKQRAEQVVAGVDNVRSVINELAVMPVTSLTQRSGDVLITGKVRASFVDASDLPTNAIKVVTERGTVYLMGRVTQREADRGTQIARSTGGVNKVVRIFEVLTPEEVRQMSGAAPAPAAAPATARQ